MSDRLIHEAAQDGNLEQIKKYMEQGEDVNVKNLVSYSL